MPRRRRSSSNALRRSCRSEAQALSYVIVLLRVRNNVSFFRSRFFSRTLFRCLSSGQNVFPCRSVSFLFKTSASIFLTHAGAGSICPAVLVEPRYPPAFQIPCKKAARARAQKTPCWREGERSFTKNASSLPNIFRSSQKY